MPVISLIPELGASAVADVESARDSAITDVEAASNSEQVELGAFADAKIASMQALADAAEGHADSAAASANENATVTTSWPLLSTALELEDMARLKGQGSGFVGYQDFQTAGLTEITGAHGQSVFGVKTTPSSGDEYKLWMKSSSFRIAGITHQISYVNSTTRDNVLLIPESPTADPITDFDGPGDFTGAGGGRLTQETIAFPEFFWEKVSGGGKDFITFQGGVHHGGTTYTTKDGTVFNLVLGTSVSSTPQAYFAFGLHDTTTIGRVLQWSTLSDAEKTKLINEQHLWIRYNPVDGFVYQRRYRVRTVPTGGNNWTSIDYHGVSNSPVLRLVSGGSIQARGKRTTFSAETQPVSNPTYSYWWKETLTYGEGGIAGQVQTTLPSTSYSDIGVVYASLWARISQRNKGAHHPKFNPNGTAEIWRTGSESNGDWWESDVKPIASTKNCFESGAWVIGTGTPFINPPWGGTTASSTSNGRPDLLFFDVVYASDVDDLSMWAGGYDLARIQGDGLQSLIQSSYRGWRSVIHTQPMTVNSALTLPTRVNVDGYIQGGSKDPDKAWLSGKQGIHNGNVIQFVETASLNVVLQNLDGSDYTETVNVGDTIYMPVASGTKVRGAFSVEPTQPVVIGSIANLPAGYLTGFAGVALRYDASGNDALPDGTEKTWKLPFWFGGVNHILHVLLYDSSAGTWADVTGSVTIDADAKTITHTVAADDNLLIFTKTKASPWSFTDQVTALNIPDRVLIHARSDSPLTEHLVGEPATMNGVRPHEIRALEALTLDSDGELDENYAPSHSTITIGDATASVGVKLSATIANVNGILEQQGHFVEVQWDSLDGDFADDGQLDIADQLATKTDAAASPRTVRIGTARRKLNVSA